MVWRSAFFLVLHLKDVFQHLLAFECSFYCSPSPSNRVGLTQINLGGMMVRSTFRAGYDGNAAIQCHSWHYHHAMNGMNGMMVHSTFRAGYAHLSLAFTLAHTNLTVHIHSTINVELAPRRREAVTVSGGWRSRAAVRRQHRRDWAR